MEHVKPDARRTLAGTVLTVCLTVAPLTAATPAQAAPTGHAVASARSFPATDRARRDPTRESVSTDVQKDTDWGGIETLNIPVTKSQAEKDAEAQARAREEARKTAAAQAAAQAQQQAAQARAEAASRDAARADIAPPASRTGRAVADYASRFTGYPYVYGGSQPTGWDCSGFVQYVYGRFGVSLPHSSGAQMTVGSPVASLADAQPGDILANPSHAAIYVGNGMVMNAMSPTEGTGLAPVGTVMGASYAIRRII